MHKVLLINPWIYDFAAFDMWAKPLGLLYIGGLLQQNGYQVELINCLDRHHPELVEIKRDEFGCGKFYKEIVEKPDILKGVPRRYGRYGLPLPIFRKELNKKGNPDVVLVTSGMTYWYPGVFHVISEVKKLFPTVPVVLGGTYATLCYDHALQYSGADYVVKGEGELKALSLVNELCGAGREYNIPGSIDEYPYPAYNLLNNKKSLAILTSRGCPFGCTYCASRIVAGKFRQRNPIKVADEIEFYVYNYGTKNFAFYDDALLINPERHIYVILDEIIERKLNCYFHTPNGMHASQLNCSLAYKMFKSGFKTIRISLETSNPEKQRLMGNKVTSEELKNAINSLKEAGYKSKDIGVYILIGLPGQHIEEMRESVKYVYNCGAMAKIAVYSPIPGTEEWEKAVTESGFNPDSDPLLHNDSIFPIRLGGMSTKDFQKVKAFALECNNMQQL
ncbi:radical SAM protein [Candidatus Poribacteria bacterium]|nr:radical SAM protein [Candidatus Poribacteria bacterium]